MAGGLITREDVAKDKWDLLKWLLGSPRVIAEHGWQVLVELCKLTGVHSGLVSSISRRRMLFGRKNPKVGW